MCPNRLTAPGVGGQEPAVWPPSGVLPFMGMALLAAPVCYVCDAPAQLYR